MLAERLGLLEHADLDLAEPAALLVVSRDPLRQPDRARQTGGSAADEQDIERDGLFAGLFADEETVERECGLVFGRDEHRSTSRAVHDISRDALLQRANGSARPASSGVPSSPFP